MLCTAQQHDDILLAGCEDGGIMAWDVRSGGVAARIDRAHATRIRGLVVVKAGVSEILT